MLGQYEWFNAEPRMIKIVSNDVILSKLILAASAAANDSPVLITGVSYVDRCGGRCDNNFVWNNVVEKLYGRFR